MPCFSCELLVNKKHRLGAGFVPHPLCRPSIPFDADPGDPKGLLEIRAARAARDSFSSARAEGLSLVGVSGYRPYARQLYLYQKAADLRYVAPPGASEHQTGLALDVSCPSVSLELIEEFARTPEGLWLASNAHLHGFILRYPKHKEKITGYAWEPWHIRYVSKSLAFYLHLTGLTLEEYHQSTAPSAAP